LPQPIKTLSKWLQQHASSEHYLFAPKDFQSLFPLLSDAAFKTLLSRAARQGILEKICRGLYAYNSAAFSDGRLLFHAAAYLRSDEFNYISLETVLSDAGIISQIPINVISIMSSGRSNKIACGRYGVIEFIHTTQKSINIMDQLDYDPDCGLWRASIKLALSDMKRTHRNEDLIDWDRVNELI
jgi:predicted transcriptional regulator of viral defense system